MDIFRFFVSKRAYNTGQKIGKNGENEVQNNYAMSNFEIWKFMQAYSSVNLGKKIELCFFAKLMLEICVLYRKIEK